MDPDDEHLLSHASRKPSGWGTRHSLVVMAFWGFAISYAMRFNLSMAIVAMVNRTRTPSLESFSVDLLPKTCGPTNTSSFALQSIDDDVALESSSSGEFDWDEAEQGLILGSFFYGYVITQLPGGIIAGKYGGKWPLGLGLLITGVFALLTPVAARTHTGLLIAVRIIQGLGEGLTTPSMHALLAVWAPPEERGRLASFTYAGTSFGTAATMLISGYLIHANVMGGWPSVFYVMGGAAIVWFLLWCIFVHDTPAAHPRISAEELLYIQTTIGGQVATTQLATPWGKIFKSLPLWTIVIAHTGHTWGAYTLLTELPTYMRLALNFDMKQNSWLSALPYLVMWISAVVLVRISDWFIAKRWMSVLNVRKLNQVIAHIGAAIALVAASYAGCNRYLTVGLLTLAVGLNGASFGAFGVNHVDIAANHAGVLMGITCTIANMSGFVAPYVAGVIVNHNATLDRWQIVFFIAAAIYVLDTIVYLTFASADEQPWNRETLKPIAPRDEEESRKALEPEEPECMQPVADVTPILSPGATTSRQT